jgi:oligopeptide transport system permease protein
MLSYILKRLLLGLLTIWFIATATFFMMHAVPGDPLSGEKAMSEVIRANLMQQYGLDKPLLTQYLIYMSNMLEGNFGISFSEENRSVNDIIREHFPVSAALGLVSLAFATMGGVLFGSFTALCRNRWPDTLIMFLVILAISVPSFVIAAFSQLGILNLNSWAGTTILPVAGLNSWHSMLIPGLVLGLSTMAYMTRLMRSSMLEVAYTDYIRSAKAKGLSPARIFFKHQLRNAILPIITVLGPAIAIITTGGFVVESVFAIPGLGRYFVQAVAQLDYTVIMGTTVFFGSFLVMMVILVDVLYGLVDPRIRVGKA